MFVLRSWLRILLFPTLILTGTTIKGVFAQTSIPATWKRGWTKTSQNLPNYQPKLHENRHKCLYQIFSYLKLRPIANDRSRDRLCDYLALFSLNLVPRAHDRFGQQRPRVLTSGIIQPEAKFWLPVGLEHMWAHAHRLVEHMWAHAQKFSRWACVKAIFLAEKARKLRLCH